MERIKPFSEDISYGSEIETYEAAKDSLSSLLAHVTKTSSIPRLGMIIPQDKFQCFVKLAEAAFIKGVARGERFRRSTYSYEQAFHFPRFKSDLYLDSGNVQKAFELYDIASTVSPFIFNLKIEYTTMTK